MTDVYVVHDEDDHQHGRQTLIGVALTLEGAQALAQADLAENWRNGTPPTLVWHDEGARGGAWPTWWAHADYVITKHQPTDTEGTAS